MDDHMPDGTSEQARFHDIPVQVTVSVGHARPSVRELLDLGDNAVLPLDRKVDDPVELYVGERLIARGMLEENEQGAPGDLAVRLTEIVSMPTGSE